MKKILMFMAAATMTFLAAAAQETVITKPAVMDNNYVGITVGADCPTNNLVKNLYPELNIYAGHQFTPVFGIELNGQMSTHRSFKASPTWVAGHYVGVVGTMNLNNLIAGYNGDTRLVEVVPFVGLGWLHTYGPETNDIATKMGVDVRIALTKNRAWQLNVRPTIAYNLTGMNREQYNVNYSRTGLEVGVTYHFKNKDGHHNFTQKRVIDYDQYLALNEEVNKLRSQKPQTVTETNTVIVKETINILPRYNVGFELNSDEISYTQMPDLLIVAKALKNNPKLRANLYGYADAGTGTSWYNMGLSERRAQAVKDVLINLGARASQINIFAEGSDTQVYDENDWNRAVVIELK